MEFYNGDAVGFDLLSAQIVLKLRELYPENKKYRQELVLAVMNKQFNVKYCLLRKI